MAGSCLCSQFRSTSWGVGLLAARSGGSAWTFQTRPPFGLHNLNRGFAKGVAGTVSLPIFSVFFRFLPFSSVFSLFSFRFLPFFPRFLSVFFRFFPFSSFFSVSLSEKKKNGETPFARPLLQNPDLRAFGVNFREFSIGCSSLGKCGTPQPWKMWHSENFTIIRTPKIPRKKGKMLKIEIKKKNPRRGKTKNSPPKKQRRTGNFTTPLADNKKETTFSLHFCSDCFSNLAHRNRSDLCDCDAHRGPQKSQRLPRQEKAMLHCDLRVRWKVASDLRFRAAMSEPKTPSFFLRDFWRFGSVNAEIASDCDCAILVR